MVIAVDSMMGKDLGMLDLYQDRSIGRVRLLGEDRGLQEIYPRRHTVTANNLVSGHPNGESVACPRGVVFFCFFLGMNIVLAVSDRRL